MTIRYLGHACFLLADGETSIVIDPYDPSIGILPPISAKLCLVSHGHHDHNYVKGIVGVQTVIDKPGAWAFGGAQGEGFASYHDAQKGAQRGSNIIQRIRIGGQTIVHMGDLGCEPEEGVINVLAGCDALLIPVGGYYTIDADKATALCESIGPRVVVPMHYKVGGNLPIATVDGFLAGKTKVSKLGADFFDPADAQGVVVLTSG